MSQGDHKSTNSLMFSQIFALCFFVMRLFLLVERTFILSLLPFFFNPRSCIKSFSLFFSQLFNTIVFSTKVWETLPTGALKMKRSPFSQLTVCLYGKTLCVLPFSLFFYFFKIYIFIYSVISLCRKPSPRSRSQARSGCNDDEES